MCGGGLCGWWMVGGGKHHFYKESPCEKECQQNGLKDGTKHQNETKINQLNQVKENSTQEMCAAKKACKKAYPRSQVNVWMVNFHLDPFGRILA